MTELEALVLDYHKIDEGEYGCPGLTCCGVQRLLAFAKRVTDTVLDQEQRHRTEADTFMDISMKLVNVHGAIRAHRDTRGDDRCWRDDEALYKLLPEGYTPPDMDTNVELSRCKEYILSRHNPSTIYISPQRRIEQLELKLAEQEAELQAWRAVVRHSDALPEDRDIHWSDWTNSAGKLAEIARNITRNAIAALDRTSS
jgi:hypothetical protein